MTVQSSSSDSLWHFTAVCWDEKTFSESRTAWTELLENSDADPLFMSWEWLHAWWQLYKGMSSELLLIALYNEEVLVALAPMYVEKSALLKGMLPVRRLQFIGKRYRGKAGIRSEYMNFIIRNGFTDGCLRHLIDAICDLCKWDELFLGDVAAQKEQARATTSLLSQKRYYSRLEQQGPTYIVNCTGSFHDYLMSLGKNTRLRLYNRRKLITKMGKVTIEKLDPINGERFFGCINDWHRQRWHRVIFDEKKLGFLNTVFPPENRRMTLGHSTIMYLDGKPLSAMLNAFAGGRIYNIQHGFEEDFDKRVSLGTLHLGYQLENAFEDPEVQQFDFLVGMGKKTNYKERLAQETVTLESTLWCRSLTLKMFYAVYDKIVREGSD